MMLAEDDRSGGQVNSGNRLLTALNQPVDIASLIVFRIGFGLVTFWWAIDYLCRGQVAALYIFPRFHLTYWCLDWIRPWPGQGPSWHFAALALLAFCSAIGFAYRYSTVLFALAFSLFFCWDRTNYQNHYYLLMLLSWMLVLLPLNRAVSVDSLISPTIASDTIPRWMLWLVRFHIALPYVFGGVSKLHSEWLTGAGLRAYLITKQDWFLIGPWLSSSSGAVAVAWAGTLYDLAIVPLLLWKWTRIPAVLLTAAFHLSNHFLFSIHIFPWFMLIASTIFFDPSWPRWLVQGTKFIPTPGTSVGWSQLTWGRRMSLLGLVLYLVFQITMPLRSLFYAGDVGWHERGHYFSWRMMLRTKRNAVRVYMTDPITRDTWNVDLRRDLHENQIERCGSDPEMLLNLAHLLRDDYQSETGRTPEVRILALTSYNGRKPQPLIDPTINLANEPRGFHQRTWIMPQREPVPDVPWNRPIREWQQWVTLPPLPKITRGPHGEKIAPVPGTPEERLPEKRQVESQ